MKLKNYYHSFVGAISPDVCQRIMDHGLKRLEEYKAMGRPTAAYTFGSHEKTAKTGAAPQGEENIAELDPATTFARDSQVAWLDDRWLYDIFHPYIAAANEQAGWNWQVDCSENFQFTVYPPSGFYSWHKDGGSDQHYAYKRYVPGVTPLPMRDGGVCPDGYTTVDLLVGKVRKISMTVNLNPPGAYEGGNLKFDFGFHVPKEMRFVECEDIRPQGSIIVFPSFLDHCVTPITRGVRYSLVLWTLGPPYR
jgi:hypothetical protein